MQSFQNRAITARTMTNSIVAAALDAALVMMEVIRVEATTDATIGLIVEEVIVVLADPGVNHKDEHTISRLIKLVLAIQAWNFLVGTHTDQHLVNSVQSPVGRVVLTVLGGRIQSRDDVL